MQTSKDVLDNRAFWRLRDRYIRSAYDRNLDWKLTDGECFRLFTACCVYCEIRPLQISRTSDSIFVYNGIDRIDPLGSYVIENCVSCCSRCNTAKGSWSLPAFTEWVERVSRCLRDRHWSGMGEQLEFRFEDE